MNLRSLPAAHDWLAFDALHDEPEAWRDVITAIAAEHASGPVRQKLEGTVLVALVGDSHVLKLYPPFLADHCHFERAALRLLQGQLSLPTPVLIATGERDGWPYTVMSQLPGEVLTGVWPTLSQDECCALLRTLGGVAAQVHRLPVATLLPQVPLTPTWPELLHQQHQRCAARHQRNGLPAHLLAQLGDFLGPAPLAHTLSEPHVMLTGEFTPMNLLAQGPHLSGMFDFGDGLVGPRTCDLLGPLCFLAAGDASRCAAFIEGYGSGIVLDDALRVELMQFLLLHRYSNLPAQIKMPLWQEAPDFLTLTQRIWPSQGAA